MVEIDPGGETPRTLEQAPEVETRLIEVEDREREGCSRIRDIAVVEEVVEPVGRVGQVAAMGSVLYEAVVRAICTRPVMEVEGCHTRTMGITSTNLW